jgi:signal transduction histidine kinase
MNRFIKHEPAYPGLEDKFINKNDLGIAKIYTNGDVFDANQIFINLFDLNQGSQVLNINKIPALGKFARSVQGCFSNQIKTRGDFILMGNHENQKIKYTLFPILNKDHKVEYVLVTFEAVPTLSPQMMPNKYRNIISELGHWTYFQDTGMLSISTETLLTLGFTWQRTNINPLIGLILQVHKPDRPALISFLKKPSNYIEFRILNDRNKYKWLKCEINKQNAGIWQGKIHDITDVKSNEDRLRAAYLEQEYFMYKSAHNLKGPTSSISALTKIAMNEVQDPTALEYLRMISESSERLEAIIKDLLNINKIKQGYLEPKPLCLKQITDAAIENLKFFNGFDQMEICTEFVHSYPIINDWNQIYSIFQNLIENAIKYRKPGQPGKLIIRSTDTTNGIMVSFVDNGSGIPEQAKEKIFDMFYRASQLQSGSGLGLYIVKTALEKIGGDIKVVSRVGVGSTFTLFLPVK